MSTYDCENCDETFCDHRSFYQEGALAFAVPESADMWEHIDQWCADNEFYPDVWFISDHGNATRLTRES